MILGCGRGMGLHIQQGKKCSHAAMVHFMRNSGIASVSSSLSVPVSVVTLPLLSNNRNRAWIGKQ